ncbi:MAG: FMN-binding protein [Planctomycetaceae bacterium]|nr:FMN-binding protein [Planctomycetaceae bacterium]
MSSPRFRGMWIIRLALALLISGGLRVANTSRQSSGEWGEESPAMPSLADIQSILSSAASLNSTGSGGVAEVLDSGGESLGFAATTLPDSRNVVGYRGPCNLLLAMDGEGRLVGLRLLSSRDTEEHVQKVLADARFFSQFLGWKLGDPQTFTHVDAVSSATLTSLAIAESVAVRLGSEKPSLRFPDDLTPDDIALIQTDTAEGWSLRNNDGVRAEIIRLDGKPAGTLLRTGPLSDSVNGYQGPSEVVLWLNESGTVQEAALRRTYDNLPYTGYLNEEPYFWKVFRGRTMPQLAVLDLQAEQVEGVSGATMTSLAVARTIVAAAARTADDQQVNAPASTAINFQHSRLHWNRHDSGTVIVLVAAAVIGFTNLRGMASARWWWNVLLAVYFGLTTGNLISLSVIAGWSVGGIAWNLAPGLTLVLLVSLLVPPLTRRNLYCSHLCPHGALQQLIKPSRQRIRRMPARLNRLLKFLPGTVLMAAVVVSAVGMNLSLADWEPFHAYVWSVAGLGSLMFAGMTLAAGAYFPMAYCRYACATGRLLDYLRRHAQSNRLTFADAVGVLLAGVVWTCALL